MSIRKKLFITLFLHQTTTFNTTSKRNAELFITLFLHQTTTLWVYILYIISCLSLYSYIKPQLCVRYKSNFGCCLSLYSYIKPQLRKVICLNLRSCLSLYSYIKPQLIDDVEVETRCCLSLYSYIKPQRLSILICWYLVVYHSIPTSNHNLKSNIISKT